MKLHRYVTPNGTEVYYFWCQPCGHCHSYLVNNRDGRPNWSFNGNMDALTFSPSLRVFYRDPESNNAEKTLCHLFVTDGKIAYCSDCPHEFAGKTVEMVDISDSYGLPGRETKPAQDETNKAECDTELPSGETKRPNLDTHGRVAP